MPAETLEFKTELKQLLHLITHSLYSQQGDLPPRADQQRHATPSTRSSSTRSPHEELLEGNKDWKIKLIPDKEAGTLTISDNGIGMSREHDRREPRHHRQVRARAPSSKASSRQDAQDRPGPDRPVRRRLLLRVHGRRQGDRRLAHGRRPRATACSWESDGQGEFTVEPLEKADPRHRRHPAPQGRREGVPRPWRLRQLVKKFSDFIEHPVVMDVEKKEEGKNETRRGDAQRPQGDLAADQVGGHAGGVRRVLQADRRRLRRRRPRSIHYTAEGQTEFKVLLFIPAHKPFELQWGGAEVGPAAVHPARPHHGPLRGAAAALPAVRQGRGRFAPTCR